MKKAILLILLCLPILGISQGWEQTFENGIGTSVQQTVDNGYIVTGVKLIDFDDNVFLLKTDSSGQEEWSQTFGEEFNQVGYFVQQTNDGGYIIAGENHTSETESDTWIIKTNAIGEEVWSQVFDLGNMEFAYSIQQVNDEGFILVGSAVTGDSTCLFLIKTDVNGEEEWNQVFGSGSFVVGEFVQQTTDGGFIIAGADDYNVYLLN